MSIDTDWALAELRQFLHRTELVPHVYKRGGVTYQSADTLVPRADDGVIVASAQVVERILERVMPNWRADVALVRGERWGQHREAAQRAEVILERDAEIREKLGDNSPQIRASTLHPWVWDSAKALWMDGHYRQAVTTAAIKVSAETQRKVGVKDRGEHDLIAQLFKTEPPRVGHPRLRLMSDDGSRTFTSRHDGAGAFARGCYQAIRNPNSHSDELPDLTEHEALEQLAAFSQLARWIDAATVEFVP